MHLPTYLPGTPGKETHPDWNIRGAEALYGNIRGSSGPGLEGPGLHKEEEAAAARKGNENKSKERMREGTKNINGDEGGERDEGAAQKETTDNRQSQKEKDRRRGPLEGNIWPWKGASRAAQRGEGGGGKKSGRPVKGTCTRTRKG